MAPAGRLAAAFFLAVTAAVSQPGLPQRIGFYQWAGVLPANAGGDLLTEARHRSVEIGARVFRLYVGARFDYIHPPYSPRRFSRDGISEPLTPARILRIPRYREVLEDPKIDTVILTVYPISDYGGGPDDLNLQRPWSNREREWEFTQTSELCRYLYQEFGALDKTVIVANSEADEKMLDIMNYSGSPEMAVENIRRWTQTRFEAIRAAREAHPAARLRILHAFEISLVNLRIAKQGRGFGKAPPLQQASERSGWNALNDVVPHVSFDLLSYSAYESTNSPFETRQPDIDPAETGSRLACDLDLIQSKARNSLSPAGRRAFGERFVMVGEFGYARDRFEHLATGGILPRLQSALQAAIDWGCPYIVLWQVFDAARNGDAAWGFGMYNRRGQAPRLKHSRAECDSIESCLKELLSEGVRAWETPE